MIYGQRAEMDNALNGGGGNLFEKYCNYPLFTKEN